MYRGVLLDLYGTLVHDGDAGVCARVAAVDVAALVAALRARPFLEQVGVPVCLVSGADRADVRAVLDRHGLRVDAVVTSEDVRAYKPRPEPFLAGPAALGIDTGFVDRDGRGLPVGTYRARTLTGLLDCLRR